MKREVRFLGVDDSPFRFGDRTTRVVGVVTRGASYVEGVLSSSVEVDGVDATSRLVAMVSNSRFRPLLRAMFLNGVSLGGFNLVDLDVVHDQLGIPVVSIVRDAPDTVRAEAALRRHFLDAEERIRRLQRLRPVAVTNGLHTVWVNVRGLGADQVPGVLAAATVRGAVPEPLRLAHVIASGIQRGESRGPV